MIGGWVLVSFKPKRYVCTNDECGHYISRLRKGITKRKARYILFDGVLDENSFVKISCPNCRKMYLYGVTAKKEESVDPEPINLLELLREMNIAKQT